jgi:adenylate cyclase
MATAALPTPSFQRRSRDITRTVRRVGVGRLVGTAVLLLLALLFARYSWTLPLGVDAERALYDVRMLITAPRVVEDDRIVMVVYTDQTLEQTGRISPLDRKLLANALTNIDAMGAKGIAIDMLIDQAQPEDQILIDAFRHMKTPVKLGFAANATNGAYVQPWQEAFMRHFMASLKPGNVVPASVRIEADSDGVMRSWPSRPAGLPPLLSNALVPQAKDFADYSGSLLYRKPKYKDRSVFAKLSIELFANPIAANFLKDKISGRYILIGGDISDIDQFDTPATRISEKGTSGTTPGLEIHANMLAQLLDHRLPRSIPGWSLWIAAIIVVAGATMAAMAELPALRAALVIVVSLVILVALPLLLQRSGFDTQHLPMFGWIGGWTLAFIAAGSSARALGSEQKRFAQSALGKYLPPDIATEILRDPDRLSLHGEKREIIVVFTDLEGFTHLSHQIEPEQVASMLNAYLDIMSDVVLAHGGTLDKFVGDAVIAFWGAPIARPDDADRAVRAAIAMYKAGEDFRAQERPGIPPVGRTRVGVHRGEAVVGNFGGEGRIQYTALGDSMNTASRLESANKQLKTALLVSREVVDRAAIACFRPMGRISVRGRAMPLEIYEPVPDLPQSEIDLLAELLRRFDERDRSALSALQIFAAERPADAALANLVNRVEKAGPGGCFALD